MMPSLRSATLLGVAIAALLLSSASASATLDRVADVSYGATVLHFEVLQPAAGATLRVRGPNDYFHSRAFDPATPFAFEALAADGSLLPDGTYVFEIRLDPGTHETTRTALQQADASGIAPAPGISRAPGNLPAKELVASGAFTLLHGEILDPGTPEGGVEQSSAPAGSSTTPGDLEALSGQDEVIGPDLIVQNSLCVGTDCEDGENFGFDTFRLKENSLRIHFDDTSTSPGYPSNDWRLIANDSSSGGLNHFSIFDATFNRQSFTVEAGARSNGLYVSSNKNVGFGTAVPAKLLHAVDGDSPALRLEQDNSQGFGEQSWDIGGNETSFFIRDVSNGDALPFRIRPGAESESIFINSNSRVGMGTVLPGAGLHVWGDDGDTDFWVEETSSTEQARVMAKLRNNGRVLWTMEDSSPNGTIWRFRTVEGQFNFDSDLGAGNEFVLDSSGNLTILGTLAENSNREAKTAIQEVNPDEVLDKVSRLPISTWAYKKQQEVSHLGPMAQDFHALFGLGATNVGITTYDTAGVALASIQALHRRVQEQEEELARKESLVEELLRRVEALEEAAD